MLQFSGTHQECDPGQRFHEEPGDGADPRDRRLYVPCGVLGGQPHHRGGCSGKHRVRHGRFVGSLASSVVNVLVSLAVE